MMQQHLEFTYKAKIISTAIQEEVISFMAITFPDVLVKFS
jgi:hypothetical protein